MLCGKAEQRVYGFVLVLGEVIIAAKDRRDDFTVLAKSLLQSAAGTERSLFDAGTDIAFVFTADLGEELIQVVDDTDPIHDASLSALGVRSQE